MRHCIHELLTSLSAHPQGHWAATEWSKGLDRWINTRGNGSFPRCPSLSQDFLFSMTSLLVFFFLRTADCSKWQTEQKHGEIDRFKWTPFPIRGPFSSRHKCLTVNPAWVSAFNESRSSWFHQLQTEVTFIFKDRLRASSRVPIKSYWSLIALDLHWRSEVVKTHSNAT